MWNATVLVAMNAKFVFREERAFWVGKSSLQCWKKLALQSALNNLEGVNVGSDDGVNKSPNRCNAGDERSSQQGSISKQSDDSGDYHLISFNEDLLCEHRNLSVDLTNRRLVSPEVWQKLKFYFPSALEFLGVHPVCLECKAQSTKVLHVKDVHRKLAAEQKLHLQELYFDKSRYFSNLETGCTRCYLLNNRFLETWRKFIKEPDQFDPVVNINNATLLCKHLALKYPPQFDPQYYKEFTFVWESEWKIINTFFNVDYEVIVTINKSDNDAPLIFGCEPEVCGSCFEEVLNEKRQRMLDYDSANIYICRIFSIKDVPNLQTSLSDTEESCTSKENKDPEFVQGESSGKERQVASTSSAVSFMPVVKGNEVSNVVRRSGRHRRGRGTNVLLVSSGQTLRDLKLLIMKLYCVAPFDQHLFLNGVALNDNRATLRELGVIPNSVIHLMVDEPIEGAAGEEGSLSVHEEGFKGTELGCK